MLSQLALPDINELSPSQARVVAEILHTRGNLDGPFLAWLLNPELADSAQRLGAVCRYGTSLSLYESELLILLVAGRFRCTGEQQIHEPIARHAGLSDAMIEAIRLGESMELPDHRLAMLWRYSSKLLSDNMVDSELHMEAVGLLGERTLVEVVAVIGYYALVAYTLNAFGMRKA